MDLSTIWTNLINEINFSSSKSGGPGGQFVNKTESKITIRWEYLKSPLFSEPQKSKISKVFSSFINKDNIIVLSSDKERSQKRNQEECLLKLKKLLKKSLKKEKPRFKTSIPRRVKKENEKSKKIQSEKKRHRKKVDF